MTAAGGPPPAALQRRRLRAGAIGFVLLTVAGLAALFAFGAGTAPAGWWHDLRPDMAALALAGALLDPLLCACRFQIFVRVVRPDTPFRVALRAELAGRFSAAVTPSQFGGGPAQVFVLQRGGVPVPAALALLLVNLISTFAVFVVAGGLLSWIYRAGVPGGGPATLFRYGLAAAGTVLGLMLVVLLRPDLALLAVRRMAGPGGGATESAVRRAARFLVDSVEQYRAACDLLVHTHRALPLASLVLTALAYLNKLTVGWAVMRALGVDPGFGTAIALLALLHLAVFAAPTPGGSGIAEVTTGAVASIVLPASVLGPFTLGYRFLLVYLPAAAGAAILLAELRPRRRVGPATPIHVAAAVRVVLAFSAAGVLGVAAAAAPGHAGDAEDTTPGAACPLCMIEDARTTRLSRAALEQAARALAARNREAVSAIDRLLQAGQLGPPEAPESRRRAQLMARLTLENWYSFVYPFAADDVHVWSVAPDAYAPIVARFTEAAAVPAPRLHELRLGMGRVCARYALGASEQGWTVMGGRRLAYRVHPMEGDGAANRVLGLRWGSTDAPVEVLVGEHYGFALEHRQEEDDIGPYDLHVARDVSGAWVRRFGLHRPAGFAFWTTPHTLMRGQRPLVPRVGCVVYVPELHFEIPLLPDVLLDDVRTLGLPMPFLDTADVQPELPTWLAPNGDLVFPTWTSVGAIPAGVRERFPDL